MSVTLICIAFIIHSNHSLSFSSFPHRDTISSSYVLLAGKLSIYGGGESERVLSAYEKEADRTFSHSPLLMHQTNHLKNQIGQFRTHISHICWTPEWAMSYILINQIQYFCIFPSKISEYHSDLTTVISRIRLHNFALISQLSLCHYYLG